MLVGWLRKEWEWEWEKGMGRERGQTCSGDASEDVTDAAEERLGGVLIFVFGGHFSICLFLLFS